MWKRIKTFLSRVFKFHPSIVPFRGMDMDNITEQKGTAEESLYGFDLYTKKDFQ